MHQEIRNLLENFDSRKSDLYQYFVDTVGDQIPNLSFSWKGQQYDDSAAIMRRYEKNQELVNDTYRFSDVYYVNLVSRGRDKYVRVEGKLQGGFYVNAYLQFQDSYWNKKLKYKDWYAELIRGNTEGNEQEDRDIKNQKEDILTLVGSRAERRISKEALAIKMQVVHKGYIYDQAILELTQDDILDWNDKVYVNKGVNFMKREENEMAQGGEDRGT